MAAMKVFIPNSVVDKLADIASPKDLESILSVLKVLERAPLQGSIQVPFLTEDPPIRLTTAGKFRILFKAREDRGRIEVLDISPIEEWASASS